MFTVSVFGAGKIGDAICGLLSLSGRYRVRVCDADKQRATEVAGRWTNCEPHQLDMKNEKAMFALLDGSQAVLSALPFYLNVAVARAAKSVGVHYLDLTEDVETTKEVVKLADGAKTCFVPQCGLAPGFISIAAAHVTKGFEKLDSVKMRVGALPIFPSNALKYNLTWSTEGLINEYGNPCEAISGGKRCQVLPLEGYERFCLDGVDYEAFNTSGGLGSLCDSLFGRVTTLDYKSVRYPGHRDLVAFLMNDLRFNEDRESLRKVFERSIPFTAQDKCLIFVEARGWHGTKYTQRTYASTVYNNTISGYHFGAIQITTAAGICAPLDLILTGKHAAAKGFVRSEELGLPLFLENEFGRYYADERALNGIAF